MAIGVWPVICGLPVFGQCNKNRKTILDDCFDERSDEPAAVCLKTKALSALDRALSKPVATVVAGKALTIDQAAEKAGRAAPGAAKVSDEKNVLLDDMLAYRMDRLVSARTIVLLDGPEGQEGRKKKNEILQHALMMAVMTAVSILGPLTSKTIALIAGKALLVSKIALVLSGLLALKKLSQPHQSSHGTDYHRSNVVDGQAYSGQIQQTSDAIVLT